MTMTIRSSAAAALTSLFLAALPSCTSTTHEPGGASEVVGPPTPALSESEAMARMMEMATPGAPHAELMARAGTWAVDYKYRMSPDADWTTAQGVVSSKPVLGGRYLMEEHAMEMMGLPMQGLLFLGFDNSTKEYTSLWMDTSSTWWVEARGTQGAEGATNMTGTMKDIAGTRPYRMKSWKKADGAMEHEMYDTIGGREVLVMTYSSRRKP